MTFTQRMAQIFGWGFILVGIAGFFATGMSMDADVTTAPRLLGVFPVNVVHNVVHLLFGVAGIAMARTPGSARNYLIGSGVIYLLLVVYGFLVPADGAANFVPVNTADNWLHVVLAIALLAGGLALGGRTARR